jgi:hypothetical protein
MDCGKDDRFHFLNEGFVMVCRGLKVWGVLGGCVAVMGLAIGCAKLPQAEMTSSKIALDSALAAQADVYAPALFSRAQDSLSAALAEIEKQNKGLRLQGCFDRAARQLMTAADLATQARHSAVDAKENARSLADSVMGQTRGTLAELKAQVEKTAKSKKTAELAQGLQAELAAAEALLGEASALLTSGSMQEAAGKALASLAKVDSVKAQLQQTQGQAARKN